MAFVNVGLRDRAEGQKWLVWPVRNKQEARLTPRELEVGAVRML
jgi:hypothetical protein